MKALSILFILFLFGCRTPEKLHTKAVERGFKHDTVFVTTLIHDTIKINGKDSIITKTVQVRCPEYQLPKPRYIIRYETKQKSDSLDAIIKQGKLDLKTEKEQNDHLQKMLDIERKMNRDNQTGFKWRDLLNISPLGALIILLVVFTLWRYFNPLNRLK